MSRLEKRLAEINAVNAWKRACTPKFYIGFRPPGFRPNLPDADSDKNRQIVELHKIIDTIYDCLGVSPRPESVTSMRGGFATYSHEDSVKIGRALGLRAADNPELYKALYITDADNFGEDRKVLIAACLECKAVTEIDRQMLTNFCFYSSVSLPCGHPLGDDKIDFISIQWLDTDPPKIETWATASARADEEERQSKDISEASKRAMHQTSMFCVNCDKKTDLLLPLVSRSAVLVTEIPQTEEPFQSGWEWALCKFLGGDLNTAQAYRVHKVSDRKVEHLEDKVFTIEEVMRYPRPGKLECDSCHRQVQEDLVHVRPKDANWWDKIVGENLNVICLGCTAHRLCAPFFELAISEDMSDEQRARLEEQRENHPCMYPELSREFQKLYGTN